MLEDVHKKMIIRRVADAALLVAGRRDYIPSAAAALLVVVGSHSQLAAAAVDRIVGLEPGSRLE